MSRRACLAAMGGTPLALGEADPTLSLLHPIMVGLVWSRDAEGHLAEGAELGRDAVNAEGGALGRRIELVRREIDPTLADPRSAAVAVARGLCQRGDLIAVIGHQSAADAIPASITYEQHGLIFLNPRVTSRALNEHGFLGTFTTVPNDSMIAQQIATFAYGLGYRRFFVLRSREDFAQEVTIAFADEVARLGMTIVDERSFTARHTNFEDVVADLGAQQFDAIPIAAQRSQVVSLIRQSFGARLDVPFLVGGFTPVPDLAAEVGKSAVPVVIPILFNPDSNFVPSVKFRRAFNARYGFEPDDWAAQGYDAVRLLAAAIKAADKADSGAVATVMRYSLSWKGVTGRHSFDRAGRVYTKQLKFAIVDHEGVHYNDVDD